MAAIPIAPPTLAPKGTSLCEQARLTLTDDTVVGRVNGSDITVADLGPDTKAAEAEALRTYCNELDVTRSRALERSVDDKLITAAASEKGQTPQEFVREAIESQQSEPTDAEVAAFYKENSREGAPPLEDVIPQVKAAISEQRNAAAYGGLIDGLRDKAKVSLSLPDVRPAAVAVGIADHSGVFGKPDARVTIVEFSDFECPYCVQAAAGVTELKAKYGDKVRFAYRHFPLSFHPNARAAAEHAQCAQAQGKFWEMHDAIFAVGPLSPEAIRTAATAAKLDMGQLDSCLASPLPAAQLAEDMKVAEEVGVNGTPSFFVNGRKFNGEPSFAGLSAAVEQELARAQG